MKKISKVVGVAIITLCFASFVPSAGFCAVGGGAGAAGGGAAGAGAAGGGSMLAGVSGASVGLGLVVTSTVVGALLGATGGSTSTHHSTPSHH